MIYSFSLVPEKAVALLELIRPKHIVKNLIVLVPWMFAGSLVSLFPILVLFSAFCLVAMAAYAFNDVIDADHDRRHDKKRFRPIPSGRLTKREATLLSGTLLVTSVYVAALVSVEAATVVVVYATLNFFYSLVAKKIPMLDVFIVAIGFVLRFLMGLLATDAVSSSGWMLAPVFFATLCMAVGKRYAKLGKDGRAGDFKVPTFYTEARLIWLMIAASQITIGITTALLINHWGGLNQGSYGVFGPTWPVIIIAIALSTQVIVRMLISRTEPIEIFTRDPLIISGAVVVCAILAMGRLA